MKPGMLNRLVFISKSMLWSLLLYAAFMVVCNWDDVSNKVQGINPITVVNNIATQPSAANTPAVVHPGVSHTTGLIKGIIRLVSSFHATASILLD